MLQWYLWSYVVLMAASVALFIAWSRAPKGVTPGAYWLVVAILLWSGIWHAVMALGGGRTEATHHTVYWAHYADWIVTAPLLALALVLTASHAAVQIHPGLIKALLAATVAMIVPGLVGELVRDPAERITAYGFGMLALAINTVLIWGPLRAAAQRQPSPMAEHFGLTALVLTALWVGFPLVWILSPAAIGLVSEFGSSVLYVVLSALMKTAWSILDVGRLRRMADHGQLAAR